MQSCLGVNASSRLLARPARGNLRRVCRVQSQSGRAEPFNETAAQVQRLVSRDRKEFLGNQLDILDKYTTEFGDPDDETTPTPPSSSSSPASSSSSTGGASSPSASASSPTVASPFAATATAAKPAAVQTKFTGSSSTASPFGSTPRTRAMQEPKGLSPDMGPDPIVKPAITPGNFLSRITLTQVVLFCTFSSMILLMLATFSVVLNSGAIRLAGIE